MKSTLCFFIILFSAYFLITSCSNDPSYVRSKRDKNAASGEIPIAEAKKMRLYYKNTNSHFKTKYFDNSGMPITDTLEGFIFEVSDIEEIIKDANGKKAKDIVFYFGRDANDVNEGTKKYPSFAIISMAIDSAGKLASKAYDKADPCPPYCPE